MRHPDKQVSSIAELIACLRSDLDSYGGPVWFRGHRDATWHLEPKLLRAGSSGEREIHLLNRFKQHASLLLEKQPRTEFDWLFLMQHYGIATRLLDWSENPLVGLYFAVAEDSGDDASLWILLPALLNALSNIRPSFEFEIPSFDDTDLSNYLPATIARESRSRLNPVAAIAPRNSARMQAQQGVFTITHRDNVYLDSIASAGSSQDHIFRYIIPGNVKATLRSDLKRLGITLFSMFPELGSISEVI